MPESRPPHLQARPPFAWRVREALYRIWLRTAPNLIICTLLFFFLLLALWSQIVYTVNPGERAVLFRRFSGTDLSQSYGEGIHFINPINSLTVYNVRTQEKHSTLVILSNNGLDIRITVVYRYHPELEHLPELHQRVGPNYEQVIVTPAVFSSIREVIGKYKPEEIYTTHTNIIPGEAFREAVERAKLDFITIDALIIENIALPPPVQEAIASKHVVEQQLLEYEFKIKREEKEFLRKEIEGKGFQRYHELLSSNLNQELLVWSGIRATKELAESPNAKVIIIGGGGGDKGGIGLPLILGGQMGLDTTANDKKAPEPAAEEKPAQPENKEAASTPAAAKAPAKQTEPGAHKP